MVASRPLRLAFPALPVLLALLATLGAPAARAGRSLNEPAAVKAVPRMVPRAKQAEALKAAGLEKDCGKDVLRSRELPGLACRLAIHGQLILKEPVDSPAAVERYLEAAAAAFAAAETVANYEPLSKKPGLEPNRLKAHEQACKTVVGAYDTLKDASRKPGPAAGAARAAVGSADKGLFKDACECAQQTVRISDKAGVSLEDRARLQGILTSRSCFLDKSKLSASRGGPDREFTGRAGRVKEANTNEARLLAYARSVDIGLDRCRKTGLTPGGKVADKGKLKRCACGEIKRWRFPKERGRPDVEIVVPILDTRVGVRVTVNAPGKVTECGPLEGSAL